MASQYTDALIQSLLAPRGGMTPGMAINQGTAQIAAALTARNAQKKDAQLQKEIADAMFGGTPPINPVQAPSDGVGPTRAPQQGQPELQKALSLAMSNPDIVRGNPILQQLIAQQLGGQQQGLINVAQGGTVFDPNTRQPVFTSPAAEKFADPVTVEYKDGSRRSFRKDSKQLDEAFEAGATEVKAPVVQIDQGGNARILSDKEAKDKGFRPGTVVQESNGKLNVVQQPKDNPTLPAEARAKLGMLDASEKSAKEAYAVLFPKEGGYRRGLLTALRSPVRTGGAAKLHDGLREAISNRLRAESGASITEQDIDDAMERYMPKPWDSEESANDKFRRFFQFISSYRNAVGNASPEAQAPQAPGNTVRFEDLPDG